MNINMDGTIRILKTSQCSSLLNQQIQSLMNAGITPQKKPTKAKPAIDSQES